MNLRSDLPFWLLKNGLPAAYPALEKSTRCDLLVVGGGITGALLADEATRRGIHTVLVDRRHVAYGSTSASTGLLQYEIDVPLHQLIRKVGLEHARRAYWFGVEAIDRLEALSGGKGEFHRRPSLMVAKNNRHVSSLHREFEARKAAGLSVRWIDGKKLQRSLGINRPAAIHSSVGAEVDPYQLAHRLLNRSQKRGLEIYDRTTILQYSSAGKQVMAETDRGCRIQAGAIAFATGYEVREMLPPDLFDISSTYALISEPLHDLSWWKDRTLIWESGDAYLYARTTADNRIIVGGADDEAQSGEERDDKVEKKSRFLLRKFQQLFPKAPALEAAFSWAGAFAHTKDGLAYIGEHPQFPRVYFALGFGGNGITYSAVASRMICDLFQGRKNPDLEIFSFNR